MKTLYNKDSKGNLRIWSIFTDGKDVVVRHGLLLGKIQEKRYAAEGKNQGKVNETTPEQQAVLEAEAKYVKQLKSGYFADKDDALAFEEFAPIKCHAYNDHKGKLVYPCNGGVKLDGMKLMIDADGNAWSKQGEPLELPSHWEGAKELAKEYGGLDGEVYAGLKNRGGLSLQKIISAFRKPNEDTPKLQYWIYDIPNNQQYGLRHRLLTSLGYKHPNWVVVVRGININSEEEADNYFKDVTDEGYEGVVYRNYQGVYEFGKRSYNLLKRKKRQTTEATVNSVEMDKNSWGILHCSLENGVNFKCQARVDAAEINYRLYENAIKLIGNTIEVELEDYSDDGVPQKPICIGIRQVDQYGRPVL